MTSSSHCLVQVRFLIPKLDRLSYISASLKGAVMGGNYGLPHHLRSKFEFPAQDVPPSTGGPAARLLNRILSVKPCLCV